MKDVTRNEIQLALKEIILIGIIQIPTKQHVSPRMLAQKYPFFSLQTVPQVRFQLITQLKHFLDSNSKVNKDPKLFQISLTIQNITSKLQNSYLPEENVSADGSVTSWKGRLGLQLYVPLKASKFAMSITGHKCIQRPDGNLKSTKTIFKHEDTFCKCIPLIILNTWHQL